MVRHKIAVANPLMQPARFTGSTSESFFRFSPETLEVPPRSEKTMELIYRPLEEGEGDAEVTLKSPELGTYPYTVNWRASPAAGRLHSGELQVPTLCQGNGEVQSQN